MSDRKAKSVQRLSRAVWKLYRRLSKGLVTWLLRSVLLLNRQRRAATGFVLPTTVFLILVVALTAGALSYRAFNSSTRTIGNIQSRAIYNAATPAIDRARAKLDYLFSKDPRLPSGVPGEEFLISMMLNGKGSPTVGVGTTSAPALPTGTYAGAQNDDPYSLTDETRIDVNKDGFLDNAWVFTDASTGTSIAYSLNMSTPDDPAGTADSDRLGALKLLQLKESQKALGDNGGPYVRNGPLSSSNPGNCSGVGGKIEGGWYEDKISTSILRKRFQVNAFVVNNKDVEQGKPANFTTLEFMQDRKLDRGNKWGAWFRYDMEIFSGRAFNWNGAMHTEGNMILSGNSGGSNTFTAYLISSPNSCVFLPESNSEISVRQFDKQQDDPTKAFYGVIAAGRIAENNLVGSSTIHNYRGRSYEVPAALDDGTDWRTGSKNPIDFASDPVAIVTDDLQQARLSDITNKDARITPSSDVIFYKKRFFTTETDTRPYVDDTYRADNRWGPKVQYDSKKDRRIPTGSQVGSPIDSGRSDLVSDVSTGGSEVGLDGYWERRTFKGSDPSEGTYSGGLRLLVGERLELGNPFGWVAPQDRPTTKQDLSLASIAAGDGDFDDLRKNDYTAGTASNADNDASDNPGDPLNPPYAFANANRAHEARQRRALRDNLAAVQATAVYHYGVNDGKYPTACLLTTSHPGSPYTLQQSVNFTTLPTAQQISGIDTRFDFFYGKGTNGWEFAPPPEGDLKSATTPIGIALRNLANFAGDPDGAFPPKQEAGKMHPDPNLTMWGNFSNLQRALKTGYDALSPADKSYLHTAGCTLTALAYNIGEIQKFDPTSDSIKNELSQLANNHLKFLMDGKVDPANGDFEVLPREQLATYDYGATTTPDPTKYNPRDYDRVTPDMLLTALKQKIEAGSNTELERADDYRFYQLAVLIHEYFQIRRDRTYGFRPSPAASTWNYNPYVVQIPKTIAQDPNDNQGKVTLWSSACDPNIFNIPGSSAVGQAGVSGLNISQSGNQAFRRLLLSRLCGTVIPAGGVHDFPGDNNYPARKDTSATNKQYLPSPDQTYYSDLSPSTSTTPNPSFDSTNTTLPASATLNAAPYNDEKYKLALVAPKFPSLYFIFPEFSHSQLGTEETIGGVAIDHRQPGNTGLDALAAAFQPWKEPFIQVANAFTFQEVSPTAVTTTIASASEDYGSGVDLTPVGSSALSGGPSRTIEALKYKAFRAFPVADKAVNLGQAADQYIPRNADLSDWKLPTIANAAASNADDAPPNRIRLGEVSSSSIGSIAAIPFLDRVLFNGREWLPSRVLDVDLEMLRTSAQGNDYWLPASGIVYAFREDAAREDAIARPSNGSATTPTDAKTAGPGSDPQQVAPFNISTKSVDYFADPDRRVHGFRLRRGAVLKRPDKIPGEKNIRGLSFITDNLAYVMGDFNLHQATPGGERLEEFVNGQLLPVNPADYNTSNFYDDRNNTNGDFADRDKDLWRPSEILADGITVLSTNFCDGSAIDTFMTAGLQGWIPGPSTGGINQDTSSGSDATKNVYAGQGAAVYNDQTKALFGPGCLNDASTGATSFLNQNRPANDLASGSNLNWVRENPSDPVNSPVKISRNGNGLIGTYAFNVSGSAVNFDFSGRDASVKSKPILPVEYSSGNDPNGSDYFTIFDEGGDSDSSRPLRQAKETTVNAILVNGIIPSRNNQSYGGLHNFPRFLEKWPGTALRFAGSFLQLNFSNYGTGPYDQDRWEPQGGTTTAIASDEETDYYGPPVRAWGYDVALQLAPASPAAARFTTPSTERNEFYSEPKANDPYMQNLCNALKTSQSIAKLNCPT